MKALLKYFFVFGIIHLTAQNNGGALGGYYVKPSSIREADVMWSDRMWKIIDLREKQNHYLYYPHESHNGLNALFNVLSLYMEESTLDVYSTLDDEFTIRLSPKEALSVGMSYELLSYTDINGNFISDSVPNPTLAQDVIRYRIIEDWYFHKAESRMKAELRGFCPVREVYDDQGEFKGELPMYWVYYPSVRGLLSQHKVFSRNAAERKTIDFMLSNRKYSSYLYKKSNVYNRKIKHYMTGIDILLEGKRLVEEVRDFEQDLWEY